MTTTQAARPAQLPHFSLVIDGQLTEPVSGRSYESIDPFLGAPWATAADAGGGRREPGRGGRPARAVRAVGPADRVRPGPAACGGSAELIARDADRLAEFETRDTGKLLREMRGQLGSIPDWFYYFAGLADKLRGLDHPRGQAELPRLHAA